MQKTLRSRDSAKPSSGTNFSVTWKPKSRAEISKNAHNSFTNRQHRRHILSNETDFWDDILPLLKWGNRRRRKIWP